MFQINELLGWITFLQDEWLCVVVGNISKENILNLLVDGEI